MPATTLAPWPDEDDVVLVTIPPQRYSEALPEVLGLLVERFGGGVVVTSNRPVRVLRSALASAGVDHSGLMFVDCISGLTGFVPPNEPDAVYIDSPTLLEKTALRAEQMLRRMVPGRRFLFIDNLSTLAVYNGHEAVSEMVHNLTTRLRLLQVGAGLLLVQSNETQALEQAVRAHCDHEHRA